MMLREVVVEARQAHHTLIVVLPRPVESRPIWQDAVRLVDELIDELPGGRVHAQRTQVEPAACLSRCRSTYPLAVAARDGGHAHVDRAAGDAQADATVLRRTLLDDVQPGHHLGHRDTTSGACLGLQHLAQHAIGGSATTEQFSKARRGCPGVFLHRLGEHGVDEPADDGRVIVGFQQVGLVFRQYLRRCSVLPFFQAADRDALLALIAAQRSSRNKLLVLLSMASGRRGSDAPRRAPAVVPRTVMPISR